MNDFVERNVLLACGYRLSALVLVPVLPFAPHVFDFFEYVQVHGAFNFRIAAEHE
jgi:hypothetical protein